MPLGSVDRVDPHPVDVIVVIATRATSALTVGRLYVIATSFGMGVGREIPPKETCSLIRQGE
ncbi:MAG: hypothetical protein EBS22_00810 [Acidimicrobiia bacterium]|nr:hypothetical protein [Acidimicrobiia bacterium]